MLYVSENIKPSRLTALFARYILVPLFPTWPITPQRKFEGYRDTDVTKTMSEKNIFNSDHPARLATAQSVALDFPSWFAKNKHLFEAPFLLLHGDADRITDPAMSKRFHSGSGTLKR